uniref:Endonuclease/exonuclease/phosphatase domain-containing protein n=1 Tax=Cannabis sativa TaxID=3483 RepID=A0A803Q9B7_CANSA
MASVWRQLGFAGASVVSSIGTAGGLCLCWKEGVYLEILSNSLSMISVRFSGVLNGPFWTAYCVYAPPVRGDRATFWDSLSLEVAAANNPWIVMGDLNMMTDQSEKFGGTSLSYTDCQGLRDFLEITGGVDLGSVGVFYTWSNGRDFQNLIRERLDRVIGDTSWIMSFPKAGVRTLPIKDSDHAPILLDLLFDRERFFTPFRFLDAWTRDPRCREVIQKAWELVVTGTRSFQLMSRLKESRKLLSKWNREVFGFCKAKLSMLEKLLVEVQSRTPTQDNLKLEADILLELEEVTKREQEIWRQKSRELWLQNGDRNTRFFHASTIIRRKRNFIGAVSDDGLEWIMERHAIGQYFRLRFMNVYSSSHCSPDLISEIFEGIAPAVTDAENFDLMRIPSRSEIKDVVWSLGQLKAPGPDEMPGRFYRAH